MKLNKNQEWYNSLKSECFKCFQKQHSVSRIIIYILFLAIVLLPYCQLLTTVTWQPHSPNDNEHYF